MNGPGGADIEAHMVDRRLKQLHTERIGNGQTGQIIFGMEGVIASGSGFVRRKNR
jgi:hypothetical protein